jgi:hypothetical protein
MATSAERMRALRERQRRGLRRLTVDVSEDDLRAIAKRGYEGAVTTNHDRQAQAVRLFLSGVRHVSENLARLVDHHWPQVDRSARRERLLEDQSRRVRVSDIPLHRHEVLITTWFDRSGSGNDTVVAIRKRLN